jgi:HSP20 family protein
MTYVKFNKQPFEKTPANFFQDLFAGLPDLFKNDPVMTEWKGSIPVNIRENENDYQLEVIAPGFERADFKVNLDQNILTVSAEKKNEENKETEKQIRREYSFSSFKRSFTIDEKIDATNIDASYINGVLKLNLPKKEEVKALAKEITIR